MYPTVEVRWFYEGEIPPQVLATYEREEPAPEQQPERVDYYLRLPDSPHLGVKLREGLVEIKYRVHQYGIVYFHESVVGQVEGWQKWSFSLAEASRHLEEVASHGWIGVWKQRMMRRYQLTDDKKIIALKAGEECNQGCEWELSSLHIEGKAEEWWSMGFEAFGEDIGLRDTLLKVVKKVMSREQEREYSSTASCGYPAWLMQKK